MSGAGAAAAFDRARLAEWLSGLAGATRGPVELTRLGAGQSNLTYRAVDAAGAAVVVRRPPLGRLAASAHDVTREGRVMAALAGTAVPVPAILGIAEAGEVADAPAVAMAEVPGMALTSPRRARAMTPAARAAAAEGLVDAMIAIHRVDLGATGLAGLASHGPYAPRQLRRWSAQWARTRTRDHPVVEELTARLAAAAPTRRRTVLVHGDPHLGNLVVGGADGRVRAVLDWELATLGDPLADVGTLLAYWPERDGLVLPGFAAALEEGFPDGDRLAARYLEATGEDPAALAYWRALGLWKVAIIAEGVLRRVRDMPANAAPAGAPTVALVDALIDHARAAADRAGL